MLRKSKVVREGEHALSIRAQEDRGRQWADQEGYRVRKVWKENLSAWSDIERPKYDAAMDAVLNGEVPALWCAALDRFSRKGIEAIGPILGKARVIFDYEQLDSSIERDRRWIIQRAEDAREYSQRLSHNVKTTKARQQREGKWLGKAPYGVVVDPVTRKVSPDTKRRKGEKLTPWAVIVRIFKSIAGGTSSRALAIEFNAAGIPSPSGGTWRANTIGRIVHHPVYCGWLTVASGNSHKPAKYLDDKGKPVRCVEPGTVRKMIPEKTAEKARASLAGHIVRPKEQSQGRRWYPLAGLLYCASCGLKMVADGPNYRCQLKPQGGACKAPASVYRSAIERYVFAEWAGRLGGLEMGDPLMVVVAERWQALHAPKETTAIREALSAVKAAEAALEAFHADDRAGFYKGRSARYRLPAKQEAENRLTAAEEQLAELRGPAVDLTAFTDSGHFRGLWEAASEADKGDLLRLAIDRVTVCKADEGNTGLPFNGEARTAIHWATVEEAAA
ncbi:recombinase family protein [Streptomyces sp. BR1]|uniref:recombinase family protein n=1 Tax=Streptomyces sp. BR1 TaxID=1592323 RepID=UPI00402BA0F8